MRETRWISFDEWTKVKEWMENRDKEVPGINKSTFTIYLEEDWAEGYRTLRNIKISEVEKYMEENNMKYATLQEIINQEQYKVNDRGIVVWRSGMDAGAFDPNIGRHMSEYIRDWFKENMKKMEEMKDHVTEMERSIIQQQHPMTPDEAVKIMDKTEEMKSKAMEQLLLEKLRLENEK